MPDIDLLHHLGDAPEGPWAIFSSPHGDGTDMISVIVPRSLWLQVTRKHPFDSEISLLERLGRSAIERTRHSFVAAGPVFVSEVDLGDLLEMDSLPWYRALRRCSSCHREVPPGEVSEGLSNALPPDSRGIIELKVLCPTCQIQTPHQLSPWGISS